MGIEQFPSQVRAPESESDPNKVEAQDVAAAQNFLSETYNLERDMDGSKVTEAVRRSNLEHTARVTGDARRIAVAEGVPEEEAAIAGALHDAAKLKHDLPGGIDTFGHHESGAALAKKFLAEKLKKSDEVSARIAEAILSHSNIPFIKAARPDVPEPKSKLAHVLRDADVLDLINIHGIKKIVEIRQNPQSKFYEQDGGSLAKAIASALTSSADSLGILTTESAKKIAEEYNEQAKRLMQKLKEAGAASVDDFRKVFKEFVEEENK